MVQAKKLGLIEKIDWAAVAPAAMFPEAKNEYGFGYQYFSTIMAWRAGREGAEELDGFFDTKAFPGKRCLPDYPAYCLPFALQATGVPTDKLFPLDVDLAFKKLNEIKKDIAVWWKAGAQPPQLMKDNEVQYAICWSGRVVGDPAFGLNFAGARPIFRSSPSSRARSPRQGGGLQAVPRDVVAGEPGQGGRGDLLYRPQPRTSIRCCRRTSSGSSRPASRTRRCSISRTPNGGPTTARR